MTDKKFAWIRVSGNVTEVEVRELREAIADTPVDSIVVVGDDIELLDERQIEEYIQELQQLVDD